MPSHRVQSIYDRLPRSAQTTVLNLYGLRNRVLLNRYSRLMEDAIASETWTFDEQKDYVDRHLRAILEHAIRYVPRYQELSRLLGPLQDDRSRPREILAEFPRTTRAQVLEDPSAFLSTAFKPGDLRVTTTSGTTGSPMKTYLEPSALLMSNALWWRRTLWAGYQPGDWTARLVGDRVVPLAETDPKQPYRISHTDRRLYLSTFHLSRGTATIMKSLLEERRPAFLQGYPSALAALAEAGPCSADWRPKAILYSSEPLYEHQREVIADFVRAPIRGQYGCAERIVSASECEAGSLHLSLLDGYVESQFGEEPPSPPAPITGLLNRAMPLIRFELGDSLEFPGGTACACGRTLPVLSPVVTKLEDDVLTTSGRVISPSILTWAFKDLPGLQKSQIVQRGDLSLEVRIVSEAADAARISRALEERLAEMTFGELPVRVVPVPDLEVTSAGKTRFVVREKKTASPSA